jgi:hypothetical protein
MNQTCSEEQGLRPEETREDAEVLEQTCPDFQDCTPTRRGLHNQASLQWPMDEEASWGGGVEGLTMKVGFLAADLENMKDGVGSIVRESEEVIQGIFERISILHCRTSRIETALGLPPWQPPESPSGPGAQSPRNAEDGEQSPSKDRRHCLRGHPLQPSEDEDGGPPRMCGFCKCSRQTHFICTFGCYFHACVECVLGESECDDGVKDSDELGRNCAERVQSGQISEDSEAPTKTPPEQNRSRSPSTSSEADLGACVNDASSACTASRPTSGKSRPVTPSTMLPEDCFSQTREQQFCDEVGTPHNTADLSPWETCQFPEDKEDATARKCPRLPRQESKNLGNNGLKARIVALEEELQKLIVSCSASSAGLVLEAEAATSTSTASLETMMACMRSELAAAIAGNADEWKKEIQDSSESLWRGVRQSAEALQKTLNATVDSLRQDLHRSSEALRSECFGHSEVSIDLKQQLQGVQQRLDAMEGDLPRGRVRVSRGIALTPIHRYQSGFEGEHGSDQTVQGLTKAVTAIARSVGLVRPCEEVGIGDLNWDEVGIRLEENWAMRAKEVWHLGLPPKPDLFDFLQAGQQQARSNGMNSTTPTAGLTPPRLPDRREAARLANRLASTSPAGSVAGSIETGMPLSSSSFTRPTVDDSTFVNDEIPTSARRSPSLPSTSLGLGPRPSAALPTPAAATRLARSSSLRAPSSPAGMRSTPEQSEAWTDPSGQQGRSMLGSRPSTPKAMAASSGRLPPKADLH